MNPNRKNLANAFLANPITNTATTMVYQTGYGSGKPAVPYFDTLTPAGQLSTMGNSEIVQVTALSGDTATIVRARKGTTAKAFPAGTIASNGIYVEDKVRSENIDWATLGVQVTGMYPSFYTSPGRAATAGNSYSRTVDLPRPREAGENVILIPSVQRWCTTQILSIGTTNFVYEEHNTINTSSMASGFSAIYYKLH